MAGPGARHAGLESRALRGGRRRHPGGVPHRRPGPPRELRDARRARWGRVERRRAGARRRHLDPVEGRLPRQSPEGSAPRRSDARHTESAGRVRTDRPGGAGAGRRHRRSHRARLARSAPGLLRSAHGEGRLGSSRHRTRLHHHAQRDHHRIDHWQVASARHLGERGRLRQRRHPSAGRHCMASAAGRAPGHGHRERHGGSLGGIPLPRAGAARTGSGASTCASASSLLRTWRWPSRSPKPTATATAGHPRRL